MPELGYNVRNMLATVPVKFVLERMFGLMTSEFTTKMPRTGVFAAMMEPREVGTSIGQ